MHLPLNGGRCFNMAEAIISRRGSSGSSGGGNLISQIITYNQNYTIPNHIGSISVLLFGGGG